MYVDVVTNDVSDFKDNFTPVSLTREIQKKDVYLPGR